MGARCSQCDWDSDHLSDGVCYDCAGIDPPAELSATTRALIEISRRPAWCWADIGIVIGARPTDQDLVVKCGQALAFALAEVADG